MAQGLEENKQPRLKQVDEKKISGRSTVRRNNVDGRAMGSRRIFAPHFKLKVLDSYRKDSDCRGNQRATARKYGIHRRQIQKWLQVEASLRKSVQEAGAELASLNLAGGGTGRLPTAEAGRLLDDTASSGGERQAACQQQLGGSIEQREEAGGETEPRVAFRNLQQGDDSGSDNQISKQEVTVTLFPSVKIEQLAMRNESPNTLMNEIPTLREELNFKPFPIETVASPVSSDDLQVKEEEVSDDDEISAPSEQALDFTCAALSKRRSFSLHFKLEVLDAFHSDRQCHGNQRATARKFGINRRQVQKWLLQELELRGETISRGGLYRQRLGRWAESEESKPAEENTVTNCALDLIKQSNDDPWDLCNRKRKSVPINIIPFKKRTVEIMLKQQNKDMTESVTSSVGNLLPEVQETALCLVKAKRVPGVTEERSSSRNSLVSSSIDVNRVMGQALYHSNRDPYLPPYVPLPVPTHVPDFFTSQAGYHDLHQVLNMYRGFVGGAKIRENLYPLDLKLKALDCYRGEGFCRESQFAVPSRFGSEQDQLYKWMKQDDQIHYGAMPRMLNIFR